MNKVEEILSNIFYENMITYDEKEIIMNQLNEIICKIITKNLNYKTGIFHNFPFPDIFHMLPVLIIESNLLDELKDKNKIELSLNNNKQIYPIFLNDSRKIVKTDFGLTMIEIKKDDGLNIDSFLSNTKYVSPCDKKIYFLYFKKDGNINIIFQDFIEYDKEKKYFKYSNLKEELPFFSPIFSFRYNRYIGVHYESGNKNKIIKDIFISDLIDLFIFNDIKNKKEINFNLNENLINENKIKENDDNDTITIIYKSPSYDYYEENEIFSLQEDFNEELSYDKLFGKKFVYTNKEKCKIIIKENEYDLDTYIKELEEFFDYSNEINFEIKLKGINNITDFSYMFCGCLLFSSIPDFYKISKNKISNINSMFAGCIFLEKLPDISILNTENIKDMSGIFYFCTYLEELPDISKWDTSNVTNISHIFAGCRQLISLPDISKWNTENIIDLSSIFYYCKKIKILPDISKWNIKNAKNISNLFGYCKSLISLPDISKWNTDNIESIESLFYLCSSLERLPDISKWNTSKIIDMHGLFCGCKTLLSLPDISKWNTINVKYMSYMFNNCPSLSYLPDISKWNTKNLIYINNMFSFCSSLLFLPDISKWKFNNYNENSSIFKECVSLMFSPDIKDIDYRDNFENCFSILNINENIK